MEHDLQASRFEARKKHDRKREIFGPNVVFDGERCIKCTRCVRFLQEITHTNELAVVNRGDHSTIAAFPDTVLDNPLSANVVDICPVGALTDRDFRFKVRVWYLQKTPSICPGCSTGCNISVETYQNRIARFKPRVNEAVNSHWLCDEGRYCFHDLTAGERLTTPMIRQEGGLVPATWEQALQAVLNGLRSTKPLAGILSGRSTNEEAFLFARLMKKLTGEPILEVFYQERELTDVQKILMRPNRSPNFCRHRACARKCRLSLSARKKSIRPRCPSQSGIHGQRRPANNLRRQICVCIRTHFGSPRHSSESKHTQDKKDSKDTLAGCLHGRQACVNPTQA